jgi:hypothetical protein
MARSNSTSNADLYQSELPQPQKEIVKRLRAFIARLHPELTESLKWHVPIYSLNGKNLLGLQDFRAQVKLIFFCGAQLHNPRGILIGMGKQVRHVTFRCIADIDRGALKEFIDQAIVRSGHCNTLLSQSGAPQRRASTMKLLEGIHAAKRSDVFVYPGEGHRPGARIL